jgi:hypothetical protein
MEMFKKIYLLLLNIKTKMGVKYVLIDSKHQRHHIDERGTTKIQVKLNQPIEHATTVEVSSFSTANELLLLLLLRPREGWSMAKDATTNYTT